MLIQAVEKPLTQIFQVRRIRDFPRNKRAPAQFHQIDLTAADPQSGGRKVYLPRKGRSRTFGRIWLVSGGAQKYINYLNCLKLNCEFSLFNNRRQLMNSHPLSKRIFDSVCSCRQQQWSQCS